MGDSLLEKEQWKKKFPAFPFKPYSIQIDFMNALYHSLDRGGIAMLESPTGTGKTLSIICSSLQWLVDQKQKQFNEQVVCAHRQSGSDDEPDWLRNFQVNKGDTVEEDKGKNCNNDKRKKTTAQVPRRDLFDSSERDDEILKEKEYDEFLVEEYESDDEIDQSKRKASEVSFSSSSDDEESKENGFNDGEEEEARLKIYFCSRTHSQLSQFVKELRRTVFPREVRVVCLSSRKNSCINEEVLKLGNPSRINDRCLELQKHKKDNISKKKITNSGGRSRRSKASSCGGCPMLKKHKVQKQFRNQIYEEGVLDIEDLVHLGKRLGTCPYYGSRSMIPAADLVILPYQSLLSRASRESLGLKLKNNIVIIDEAHNLADSLISMYDSKITLSQLDHVHSLLESYFGRFRNVLGPGNRRYIQTLMVITRAFTRILLDKNHSTITTETCDSSMAINEFLFSLNIDNINLIKLLRYIKESNIIHKASGYGDRTSSLNKDSVSANSENSFEEGSNVSSFQALGNMLLALNNRDGDGRLIISKGNQGGEYLKYVMLSGEKIFSEIANEVRAVILAGGTLQPIEETRERLFPSLKPDQLHFFSCNHIVSPNRILPLAVSNGPTGQSFDFSFGSRSSPTMIEELGRLICNLVTVIPEGIVLFFSSFDYEAQVHDAWKSTGIISRISKRKRLFREPRGNKDVDIILNEYKTAISEYGSILLAVVGGKVSEGINFSDGMGRCIIMVGLPYPSPSDIELIERIKHIDGFVGDDSKTGLNLLRCCGRRGKEYYENLCMKAVNQSIGRAIRHMNDYAAILLVDSRYAATGCSRPTNKLPDWIRSRLSSIDKYGEVHRLLHQFFKLNKSQVKV